MTNLELKNLKDKSVDQYWFVDYEELSIADKPFASGSTSSIFDCVWRGINIVVKILKIEKKKLILEFINEILIWNSIKHPNIVQFLGISIKDQNLYILLQKINGVNLKDYLNINRNLSNQKKLNLVKQLSSVILFLHKCKPAIIFRDLKAENILVEDNKLYLTDFGLSRFMPEKEPFFLTGNTGTLRYMAPEVYFNEEYNLKADIYGLGMIIYFIFKGELPLRYLKKSTISKYFNDKNDMTVDINNSKIKLLIQKCIKKNSNLRFNIDQVIEYINNINFDCNCCFFITFK